MQQLKRWGSTVGVLVVGIALGLTWSVVGARQAKGGVSKAEDGGYVEHMMAGDPGSSRSGRPTRSVNT